MKTLLRRLYYWGLNTQEGFQNYQQKIRDVEWNAVVDYIPRNSSFFDIGCGTGYSMNRAVADRDCTCIGIDPSPNIAGVKHGRRSDSKSNYWVRHGIAENIPLPDESVDVVYCSHVLEHVQNEELSLMEMSRVVKHEGVIIIGVPTASMSLIRLISILIFESHRNLLAIMLWPFKPSIRKNRRFLDLIIPPSHGQPGRSIFFDLFHYRVRSWRKLIESQLIVEDTLLPAIYPFPDYLQLFKMRRMKNHASSVFFICKAVK